MNPVNQRNVYPSLYEGDFSGRACSKSDEQNSRPNANPQLQGNTSPPNQVSDVPKDYSYSLNQSAETNAEKAYNLFKQAAQYFGSKDYDNTIDSYTKLVQVDPNNESAYFNRGVAYLYKDDYDSALADFTKSFDINPQKDNAVYSMALCYKAKGDDTKGLENYTKALALNPNLPALYSQEDVNSYLANNSTPNEVVSNNQPTDPNEAGLDNNPPDTPLNGTNEIVGSEFEDPPFSGTAYLGPDTINSSTPSTFTGSVTPIGKKTIDKFVYWGGDTKVLSQKINQG